MRYHIRRDRNVGCKFKYVALGGFAFAGTQGGTQGDRGISVHLHLAVDSDSNNHLAIKPKE